MSESVITVSNLTRDYGRGRGVFGLDFEAKQGEAFGLLGPNGAGKTTTIRQLMGFVRPDSGSARIFGKECFTQAARVQRQVGYLPGELALMDDMTGMDFIRLMAGLRGSVIFPMPCSCAPGSGWMRIRRFEKCPREPNRRWGWCAR